MCEPSSPARSGLTGEEALGGGLATRRARAREAARRDLEGKSVSGCAGSCGRGRGANGRGGVRSCGSRSRVSGGERWMGVSAAGARWGREGGMVSGQWSVVRRAERDGWPGMWLSEGDGEFFVNAAEGPASKRVRRRRETSHDRGSSRQHDRAHVWLHHSTLHFPRARTWRWVVCATARRNVVGLRRSRRICPSSGTLVCSFPARATSHRAWRPAPGESLFAPTLPSPQDVSAACPRAMGKRETERKGDRCCPVYHLSSYSIWMAVESSWNNNNNRHERYIAHPRTTPPHANSPQSRLQLPVRPRTGQRLPRPGKLQTQLPFAFLLPCRMRKLTLSLPSDPRFSGERNTHTTHPRHGSRMQDRTERRSHQRGSRPGFSSCFVVHIEPPL